MAGRPFLADVRRASAVSSPGRARPALIIINHDDGAKNLPGEIGNEPITLLSHAKLN